MKRLEESLYYGSSSLFSIPLPGWFKDIFPSRWDYHIRLREVPRPNREDYLLRGDHHLAHR